MMELIAVALGELVLEENTVPMSVSPRSPASPPRSLSSQQSLKSGSSQVPHALQASLLGASVFILMKALGTLRTPCCWHHWRRCIAC